VKHTIKTLPGIWLLLLIVMSACSRAPAALAVSPLATRRIDLLADMYLRQIGEGAFVITHNYPWPANSLLVEMTDGTLVLVGTPYTPEATRAVLNWAYQKFGKSKIVAINPGYHVDNLGGNQALLDANIPIYGSDLTVQLLHDRGEQTRQVMLDLIGDKNSPFYKAYQQMVFVAPTRVFPIHQGITLDFGGEKVQVLYPGASQAPDKLAVYFPARRLLFGSCMVLGGNQIGNAADADMQKWPAAIRNLEQYPVDVVVPGHGDRLDPGLLQHTLDLLAAVP
jgi:metallo-beta-lactamase class B